MNMNLTPPGYRAYEDCYRWNLCRGVCESCSHSSDWDWQERVPPSVRAGVSFVIPSFARPHNLYTLLPGLLRHRTMQHQESEIIVSHASARSWRERLSLDNSTRTACAPKACASNAVGKPFHRLCGECAPPPWRIRHLDHALQNREFLTALRFVAAAEARNGGAPRPAPPAHNQPRLQSVTPRACCAAAIVYMDDDLQPTPTLLDKLVWRAVRASKEGTVALFGARRRTCNASGYSVLSSPQDPATLVLTNLASSTAQTSAAFVRLLRQSYLPLLQYTVGNGEDLLYAHFVRTSARATVRQVRGAISSNDQGGALATTNSHSHEATHLAARGAICKCLAAGFTGDTLARCVRGRVDISASKRTAEPPPDSFYPSKWYFPSRASPRESGSSRGPRLCEREATTSVLCASEVEVAA